MKTLITLFGILLFSISAAAQEGKVYEYLTMVKVSNDLHISIGGTEYEVIDIKQETDNKTFDLRAINSRISVFESEGWEFVSLDHTNPGAYFNYLVMMRRPKE
jgi:hypothetical protein